MTKKKTSIPPEVVQNFKDCQSLFPAGYVKKWGTKDGLEYYQFVIPDGEDGPPLTGYPLICAWDEKEATEIYGEEVFHVLCQFLHD